MAYQLYYRLTGRLTRNEGAGTRVQTKGEERSGTTEKVVFSFLNREVVFPTVAAIDWNYAELGKLWTYNLNYFEFLDPERPTYGQALIDAWIVAEAGHRDGWEPYPLSLRLIAWLRFYADADRPLPDHVRASVTRQYKALWGKLEYHLGGNHLLENALALSLTARFLEDEAGGRRAVGLLTAELAEQYLPDGAHYELSPMYHLVLLDRTLTVYQGLTTTLAPASAPEIRRTLQTSLQRQLGWAGAFCTPDGRYAHFNDSTPGIAPSLAAVLDRAKTLGLKSAPTPLSASGYRRFSNPGFDLWIDVAAIGPAYIPGHAHADNLTFTLHYEGRPLLVDTAVSTYEKNDRRARERATASHNTVTVGGRNSSDVWGGFRVGRRATTTIESETPNGLTARHDGYGTPHRRTFALDEAGLSINDELSPGAEGVARFHFHHDRLPELTREGCVVDNLLLNWPAGRAKLKPYEQAVGWNETRPGWCLDITFTGSLSFRLTTQISGA